MVPPPFSTKRKIKMTFEIVQEKNHVVPPEKNLGRPFRQNRISMNSRVKYLETTIALILKELDKIKQGKTSRSSPLFVPKNPNWVSWVPSRTKKPDVGVHKVRIMQRNGEITPIEDARPIDQFSWGECGDLTIVAYKVV